MPRDLYIAERGPSEQAIRVANPQHTIAEYAPVPPLRVVSTDVAGLTTDLVEALTLADAIRTQIEQVVGLARLCPTSSLLEPWKDMRDAITDAKSHAEGFHASALDGDL